MVSSHKQIQGRYKCIVMYIHGKQKVGHLYNFHKSQQSTQTKIKCMLVQIYKIHSSTKQLVHTGEFCEKLRKQDSAISNWAKIVNNLDISRINTLKRSQMIAVTPHKQHMTPKLNLRISMAMTMRALEIRGVNVDIIYRTRQKLDTFIENSVTPFQPRVDSHVHKKPPNMRIMSPKHS